MTINKNDKIYTVVESSDKWIVKLNNGKFAVSFDVSKSICSNEDELCKYILSNDELF